MKQLNNYIICLFYVILTVYVAIHFYWSLKNSI